MTNDKPIQRKEEQTAAFILSLDNTELKWKVLSLLAFTTGLRVGELVGLEWKHIDLDKQTLSVKQITQYVSGKGLITKAPKTESSRRVIALSGNIVELLKHYRTDQNAERLKIGDKWLDNDRLFTTWDGQLMYPGSFTKWIGEFCVKNNLPRISPHSLRHLSATILINHGVSLKNISARLGHSQTSITGDIYTHFLKSADQAAADKMGDVLKSISDTALTIQKKQVK